MTRKLINLRLPPELVARVDAEAEHLGQTRTKFVERALESALRVPELDTLGPSPSLRVVKAAAAKASERQRYSEGTFSAAEAALERQRKLNASRDKK